MVLEEIAMRDDDPEDAIGDVFLAALFGEHPVGRPVVGTRRLGVVDDARAAALLPRTRRYTPERMVVAVAGNVDHDQVVSLVRRYFGGTAASAAACRCRRARAQAGCRADRR